ncbi:ComEA family DNA-binding protein [Orbus mooreae]|uniref:ComEA family DNA-binding protein n=1 Tax=Orbus mooreae TaxID=3074107 RepID=UPI00370D41B6
MKSIRHYLIMAIFGGLSLLSGWSIHAEPTATAPLPLQKNEMISQVNINQASAEEIAKYLNGIGLSKAKKIVEYREKFGPFVSIEQLKEVSGIGQSIIDRNIGKLVL